MATKEEFIIRLEIDPHPHGTGHFGHLDHEFAVFARPFVNYEQRRSKKSRGMVSSKRLFAAFLDSVRKWLGEESRGSTLAQTTSLVVEAAREAFSRLSPAGVDEFGFLDLSLVVFSRFGGLRVFNIGSNVVLEISLGKPSLVVDPHSPLYNPAHASSPGVGKWASVSTAILEPEMRYADELRAKEIELRSGGWLLVAPGSSVAKDLSVLAQPETFSQLEREVIDRLATPYPGYERSWLAIGVD